MESRLNVDIELQTMIYKMNFKETSTHRETIDSIIARLKSDGLRRVLEIKKVSFYT